MSVSIVGLDDGLGNVIRGEALSTRRSSIRFLGKNGKLIIHENVTLEGVNIHIYDGATIEIGAGSRIKGSLLAHVGCEIRLGDATRCNGNLNISTAEETVVSLGKGCLIASAVIRSSDMHPIYDLATNERLNMGANVVIGEHVWFAQESMVLKGVTIGSGAVLAARSLVVSDVPANALVGGSPAKVLREDVRWHGNLPLRRSI